MFTQTVSPDMHTTLPLKDTAPGGGDTERFAQILLGGRGGPDVGKGAVGGPAGWRGGSLGVRGVHCELKSCVHVVGLCVQGVCSCVVDMDVVSGDADVRVPVTSVPGLGPREHLASPGSQLPAPSPKMGQVLTLKSPAPVTVLLSRPGSVPPASSLPPSWAVRPAALCSEPSTA